MTRLTLVLVVALAAAAPALAGDGLGQRKASVDAKLQAVQAKIAQAHRRATALSTEIGDLTSEIHSLEGSPAPGPQNDANGKGPNFSSKAHPVRSRIPNCFEPSLP